MAPADIHIDLLKWTHLLRIRTDSGQRFIFDPVRKKWIRLTSEEFVRQLLIQYLTTERGFPQTRISVEREVAIEGISRRYDIAVFDRNLIPLLLVECKSPATHLDQAVFDQILHYNMALDVRFLILSNGTKNYCCSIDRKARQLVFHPEVPTFRDLETG